MKKLLEARLLTTEGSPESAQGFRMAIKKLLELLSTGWQLDDFIEEARQFEIKYNYMAGDDYYEASMYARRLNIKYLEEEQNGK